MIYTWKRRGLIALLSAALFATMLPSATATAALRYPDLQTLPPRDISLGTEPVNGESHYVIRLSNWIANAGTGPLELHGTPHLFPLDLTFDVAQWIYDDAGLAIEPIGTFYFHEAHRHFHFDAFARYEVWTKRGFKRARSKGFTSGRPWKVSAKVSFCVQDSRRARDDAPGRFYSSCTPTVQGLSPGWADVYQHYLSGQIVDLGPRPPRNGTYVIRSIADPENKIFESPGKADSTRESQIANSAVTYIKVFNGRLAMAPSRLATRR